MQNKESLPFTIATGVFFEYLKGLLRLFRLSHGEYPSFNNIKVKNFFTNQSLNSNFSDFTDSTKSWYLRGVDYVLNKYNINNHNSKKKILDLGSGRGGLINHIKSKNLEFEYIGVDFDEEAILKCSNIYKNDKNIRFVASEVVDFIKTDKSQFDFVFIINLLPYIDNLKFFISHLQKKKYKNIILCEPHPSPYWEKSFGGFSVFIRNSDLIQKILIENGFIKLSEHKLYVFQFFNIYILRISTTNFWQLKYN